MNRARLRLGRHSRIGQTYLLTSVTQGRRRDFEDAAAAHVAMDVVRRIDAEGLTHSLAYVVMPDHIHWLVELRAFSLNYIMQRFKSSSALRINRMLGRSGRFWQSNYHDHAIRSDESLFRHAMYVVGNPIRAGLATQLGEYPHAWCRWEMDGKFEAIEFSGSER
ncbi:transposase [Stenotrophomonas sp. CC22-02]|uniref:REP-associated tyrosine transposase n=1 Tax=Stenotrophomonas sp. CC22-02 TaxID=1378087 RepID=UPI0010643C6E|nr:transposase [Stenotrophomonas sp. CC22-02]TDV29748.1 REP element-mobilizing transposase RayT [Stenotrophomonas sp. CC22-02]